MITQDHVLVPSPDDDSTFGKAGTWCSQWGTTKDGEADQCGLAFGQHNRGRGPAGSIPIGRNKLSDDTPKIEVSASDIGAGVKWEIMETGDKWVPPGPTSIGIHAPTAESVIEMNMRRRLEGQELTPALISELIETLEFTNKLGGMKVFITLD